MIPRLVLLAALCLGLYAAAPTGHHFVTEAVPTATPIRAPTPTPTIDELMRTLRR